MRYQLFASLAFCVVAIASSHSAQADEAKIAAAVKTINPTATVRSIKDIPGTGLKEVVADNSVVYMDPNGRYLFFGTLLDLESKKNLSEETQASVRVNSLRDIPLSEKIIYSPKDPKYRITVFTDITCGYCHKVQENLQGYLDRGIAVEYVAFPRGGAQTAAWTEMRKIWCAKDRKAAYEQALRGEALTNAADCNDPVARHYKLGDTLGIEGTPAIFSEDGKQLGGFLPPDRMAAELNKKSVTPVAIK